MYWLIRHSHSEGAERERYELDYKDAIEWLEKKPETWQTYENKNDGKRDIMEMEISEFNHAIIKDRAGELTPDEMKVAVEHVIASALAYHCFLRKRK